ncbi:MAG: hypothetical protein CSA32_00215 [Desulfobulbus propionicus]|nr:MAG: hypothetical protein CSA32_00215 [Desulfobulbus propionicus]
MQKTDLSLPGLLVFFGLTASGKSTLAQACAKVHELPYYNTDRVRKELAGLSPSTRRPDGINQGIYTAELTRKTYRTMLGGAMADIHNGHSCVVLDGSYSSGEQREEVVALASSLSIQPVFVFCVCSEEEVRRRLQLRAKDTEAVSDGRWEIYLHQLKSFDIPKSIAGARLIQVNTEQEIESLLTTLENLLNNTA